MHTIDCSFSQNDAGSFGLSEYSQKEFLFSSTCLKLILWCLLMSKDYCKPRKLSSMPMIYCAETWYTTE